MSKNTITLPQIEAACRHVAELIKLGMTENLAIRNLELFANVYAKHRIIGSTSPDHVTQFPLWSQAARAHRENGGELGGRHLRVEHGTPRRQFARLVLKAFHEEALTQAWLDTLCEQRWKVAVITLDEDRRLNRLARSKLYDSPEERWQAAGIIF
jgi:hypothetical protein